MKTAGFIFAFLGAVLIAGPTHSAQESIDQATQTAVYRSSIAQDDLRVQTARVKQELRALFEDFRQSLPPGPEQEQIKDALARLENLSDQQMSEVVQMLRDASVIESSSDMQNKLLKASEKQKSIQALLRTFADRLSLDQAEASLSQRVRQLRIRQVANLRQLQEIIALGKSAPKTTSAKAALSNAEQTAISTEATLLLSTLKKLSDPSTASKRKPIYTAALQKAEELQLAGQASRAGLGIAAGRYPDALAAQQAVIDALQGMIQALATGDSLADRFQTMAAQLREIANAQTRLADSVTDAPGTAQKGILDAQRNVGIQLDAVQVDLQSLNVKAATLTEQAQADMANAEKSLQQPNALKGKPGVKAPDTDGPRSTIINFQNSAAGKITQASSLLEMQLAEISKSNAPKATGVDSALSQLQAMQQAINQAINEQKALNNNPANAASNANAQTKVADQTAALQNKALPVSPAAASALGSATHEMQQISSKGSESSQKAVEKLTDASRQLQAQIQDLTHANTVSKGLQDLAAQIEKGKAQSQQAAQTIQKSTTNDLTAAVKEMDGATALLKEARTNAKNLEAMPPEVDPALNRALQHLDQSKLQAVQSRRAQAVDLDNAAQKDCDAALEALRKAAADVLAKAMPESPGDDSSKTQADGSDSKEKNGEGKSDEKTDGKGDEKGGAKPDAKGEEKGEGKGEPKGNSKGAGKPEGKGANQAGAPSGSPKDGPPNGDPGMMPGLSGSGMAVSRMAIGDLVPAQGGGVTEGLRDTTFVNNNGPLGTVPNGAVLQNNGRDSVPLVQGEKIPPEYSSMIQQYTKNLANGQTPW